MSLARVSSQWKGIKRPFHNAYVETCYNLYADMDAGTESPYLQVSGFNIYASSQGDIASLLPATVTVRANNGTTYTFTTGSTVLRGAYSPSGNWMAYFVSLSSDTHISIPGNGATFSIAVTVTPNSGTALSFTESACGPQSNTLTVPNQMVTGRVYSFAASRNFSAGGNFKTVAELTWFPRMTGVYTTQVYESGYVDPYTKTSDATSAFSTIYFAVANMDGLPEAQAAGLVTPANVVVRTIYNSASFTGGIVILEMTASIPCSPRDDVDEELSPTLTTANVTFTCSPAEAVISGKYVHRNATITCTPVAQFKYGDSLSYIHYGDSNRYGSSVSFQALGVEPGTSYVRPDTGSTATAGNESVAGLSICVYGSKWKKPSATVLKTYTVLWYHAPNLTNFALHRASVSSTSTSYVSGGTYYKKDDFGAYCIIEYAVNFAPLNNSNTTEMVIQYGTHRTTLTPSYTQSGYLIVSAPTASKLDVVIALYDRFYPYGVASSRTLSTGAVLIDFLNGGKGMAVGKAATSQNTLDIASNWKLLFYQATIGGYNGAAAVDLIAWMRDIDARLTHIETSEYANT